MPLPWLIGVAVAAIAVAVFSNSDDTNNDSSNKTADDYAKEEKLKQQAAEEKQRMRELKSRIDATSLTLENLFEIHSKNTTITETNTDNVLAPFKQHLSSKTIENLKSFITISKKSLIPTQELLDEIDELDKKHKSLREMNEFHDKMNRELHDILGHSESSHSPTQFVKKTNQKVKDIKCTIR